MRVQDFHNKTQPILELFRRKELVVVVDGTQSAAEVQQNLRHQLEQKAWKSAAADSATRTN